MSAHLGSDSTAIIDVIVEICRVDDSVHNSVCVCVCVKIFDSGLLQPVRSVCISLSAFFV